VAGHLLADAHVHRIEVRAFLPVDLDGNEVLVEQFGDVLVGEALVGHDVTPVTRRVADREEDGFLLLVGLLEGCLVPRLPVDGVVRVLAEIGTLLLVEAVPCRRVGVDVGHTLSSRGEW